MLGKPTFAHECTRKLPAGALAKAGLPLLIELRLASPAASRSAFHSAAAAHGPAASGSVGQSPSMRVHDAACDRAAAISMIIATERKMMTKWKHGITPKVCPRSPTLKTSYSVFARKNHVGRVDANRIDATVFAWSKRRRSLAVCRSTEPAIGIHCSR